MTDIVKGRTLDEARALFDQCHEMVTAPMEATADADLLGKLAVFAGVREFPVRVKCASLAWHAMRAAVQSAGDPVSTE